MKPNTRKKLNEILKRFSQGESKEDIIRNKFSRSPTKYKDFYDLVKDEILQEERELFKIESVEVKKKPKKEPQRVKHEVATSTPSTQPLKEILGNPQHLKTLESLILKGGELLELLEPKEEAHELHILEVPNEFLELKDLKVSSKRISLKVEKAFNELAAANKQFSKTSLLNLALWEFTQKYKK